MDFQASKTKNKKTTPPGPPTTPTPDKKGGINPHTLSIFQVFRHWKGAQFLHLALRATIPSYAPAENAYFTHVFSQQKGYILVQYTMKSQMWNILSNYFRDRALNSIPICDMIKGNESHVENFNFCFLTPFSHNFKMLHFESNPITIGYLVTKL